MSDEVSGGPAAPGRGRAALVILVAVVFAVLAVTALRRGVDSPETALTPPPTRSPAASVPPTPALALGDVCRPARVTGPNALDVSFSLRNNSSAPATLVSVEPRLPLAGLLERGYTIRSGTCAQDGRTVTDSRLERVNPIQVPPAGWVVATLHFALPDTCPKPYPVQAVVTELPEPDAPTISTPYPLLPDLGDVSFPSC
ncbi:MAG TPA: hypothetical protein VI357_20010 [Mycobacteriales bacterium]